MTTKADFSLGICSILEEINSCQQPAHFAKHFFHFSHFSLSWRLLAKPSCPVTPVCRFLVFLIPSHKWSSTSGTSQSFFFPVDTECRKHYLFHNRSVASKRTGRSLGPTHRENLPLMEMPWQHHSQTLPFFPQSQGYQICSSPFGSHFNFEKS